MKKKITLLVPTMIGMAALALFLQGCGNGQNKPTVQQEQAVLANEEEKVEVELDQDDGKYYLDCPNNHHPHSIDLGLPSGTIWACCNIGASAPEEVGDFFAWGETSTKEEYNGNTYKWCKNGNVFKMTKYCTNGDFGNVDNKTSLDVEDDAAYVNWGDQWRMPTEDQLMELMRNTSSEWESRNGMTGKKLTSMTNGASIFLPSNMLNRHISQEEVDYGVYISSTLGSFAFTATCFWAVADEESVGERRRELRSSIRPVRKM